jgi:hypothetical protein
VDLREAVQGVLESAKKRWPDLKGAYWMEEEQILRWIPPERGYVDSFRLYLAKNLEGGGVAWGKIEFGWKREGEGERLRRWTDRLMKFCEEFAKGLREGTVQIVHNDQEVLE